VLQQQLQQDFFDLAALTAETDRCGSGASKQHQPGGSSRSSPQESARDWENIRGMMEA
jgi:hypothetical protein